MEKFKKLHQQTMPLLLGNVWDASSAKCAQEAGYQAIGTSSAAVANLLGYEDGEQMPFSELAFMVQRIASASLLPLTVDIEAGYSQDPKVIADHIQELAELGVVGINIEDSRVDETRSLTAKDEFSQLLSHVCQELKVRQIEMFINVRCDAFLLGLEDALEVAIERAKSYQETGADGLFFPCITKAQDIKALVATTPLPINVMSMPELPNFEVLADLGVKRISTGNFAYDAMYAGLGRQLSEIKKQGSYASLFS